MQREDPVARFVWKHAVPASAIGCRLNRNRRVVDTVGRFAVDHYSRAVDDADGPGMAPYTGTLAAPDVTSPAAHTGLADDLDRRDAATAATLADYLMPSAAEFPSFELDHIEDPADTATGARGVGEGGTLGPAAALANAVSDALGTAVDELPLSPEVVHRAARRATPPPT